MNSPTIAICSGSIIIVLTDSESIDCDLDEGSGEAMTNLTC